MQIGNIVIANKNIVNSMHDDSQLVLAYKGTRLEVLNICSTYLTVKIEGNSEDSRFYCDINDVDYV